MDGIKAFISAGGDDIYVSQLELKTPLGPLSFPSIGWSSAQVEIEIKKSEVIFKSLRLGKPNDDFNIQMQGSGALGFSYGGRPQLTSYNLELQIDLGKDFPLRILDLMFSDYKEDKGGFYRYSVRLIGRGNQFPNMEKLDGFTLEN